MTGLPAAGKTTLAEFLRKRIIAVGRPVCVLDGDRLRLGLNRDLGFSDNDRSESIRRAAEAAKLFVDTGLIAIVAHVSPFRADRQRARQLFGDGKFIEIYVATPLSDCEKRDPKGLYQKARNGELQRMTGISSPYEAPEAPEISINGAEAEPEVLVERITRDLAARGLIVVI